MFFHHPYAPPPPEIHTPSIKFIKFYKISLSPPYEIYYKVIKSPYTLLIKSLKLSTFYFFFFGGGGDCRRQSPPRLAGGGRHANAWRGADDTGGAMGGLFSFFLISYFRNSESPPIASVRRRNALHEVGGRSIRATTRVLKARAGRETHTHLYFFTHFIFITQNNFIKCHQKNMLKYSEFKGKMLHF